MSPEDKPLIWLSWEVKTPPMSSDARIETGFLLRQLQAGNRLSLPHLRPMPSLGPRCCELRVQDARAAWRVMLRVDSDAIVILDVFRKTTSQTPQAVLEACRQRLRRYDKVVGGR
jgi:phage-related protein